MNATPIMTNGPTMRNPVASNEVMMALTDRRSAALIANAIAASSTHTKNSRPNDLSTPDSVTPPTRNGMVIAGARHVSNNSR